MRGFRIDAVLCGSLSAPVARLPETSFGTERLRGMVCASPGVCGWRGMMEASEMRSFRIDIVPNGSVSAPVVRPPETPSGTARLRGKVRESEANVTASKLNRMTVRAPTKAMRVGAMAFVIADISMPVTLCTGNTLLQPFLRASLDSR